MNELTENKDGLQKVASGVICGINLSKTLGITMIRQSDNAMITMQFSKLEVLQIARYIGGDKLIYQKLKEYEQLHDASLDRMEELRDTIKRLLKIIDRSTEKTPHVNLEMEKAKKELE